MKRSPWVIIVTTWLSSGQLPIQTPSTKLSTLPSLAPDPLVSSSRADFDVEVLALADLIELPPHFEDLYKHVRA